MVDYTAKTSLSVPAHAQIRHASHRSPDTSSTSRALVFPCVGHTALIPARSWKDRWSANRAILTHLLPGFGPESDQQQGGSAIQGVPIRGLCENTDHKGKQTRPLQIQPFWGIGVFVCGSYRSNKCTWREEDNKARSKCGEVLFLTTSPIVFRGLISIPAYSSYCPHLKSDSPPEQ